MFTRHERAAVLATLFKVAPKAYGQAAMALAKNRSGKGMSALPFFSEKIDPFSTDTALTFSPYNAAPVDNATVTAVTNAAVDNQPWYVALLSKISDIAPDALKAYVAVTSQADCNKINLTLAQQGKPLIDCAQAVGTNVNVGIAAPTQKLMIYGGAALLFVLALAVLKKR